ncbi:MAG: hypothetical protein IIB87_05675 [Chloroflexi bacterium]|nr:hypothetical protein [Chloroflexota bacterium]
MAQRGRFQLPLLFCGEAAGDKAFDVVLTVNGGEGTVASIGKLPRQVCHALERIQRTLRSLFRSDTGEPL